MNRIRTRIIWVGPLFLWLCFPSLDFSQRNMSDETKIFNSCKNAVFTVFSSDGHGTGFLVDSRGLILTNEHVVRNPTDLRVAINDSLKVAARRVITDSEGDLAVILIHNATVVGVPALRMAPVRNQFVVPGEKVIAIGSPMNRNHVITSGIISEVADDFLLSDVNMNPGNSGGPLLNLDGEVVGVNSFLYSPPSHGLGLSGAVSIWRARRLIERAIELLATISPPEARRLLTMPKAYFPLNAIARAALGDEIDEQSYKIKPPRFVENYDSLDYEYMCDVRAFTPPYLYRKSKEADLARSSKMRSREEEGGVSPDERYNPFADLKEWGRVGDQFKPVVTLAVLPRSRQTGQSFLLNMFLSTLAGLNRSVTPVRGVYDYEFASDLRRVDLVIDQVIQEDIVRSSPSLSLSIFGVTSEGVFRGNDMARGAILLYPLEVFAPRNGSWPEYKVKIVSLTEPRPTHVFFNRENLERIWVDFEPFRESQVAENTPCLVNRTTIGDPAARLGIRLGMTAEELLALAKRQPDLTYEIECGKNTGSTWKATVYKYYGPKDPLYTTIKVRQANTFFFCDVMGILKLNHWTQVFPLGDLIGR